VAAAGQVALLTCLAQQLACLPSVARPQLQQGRAGKRLLPPGGAAHAQHLQPGVVSACLSAAASILASMLLQ
jgi:hypothetical protein